MGVKVVVIPLYVLCFGVTVFTYIVVFIPDYFISLSLSLSLSPLGGVTTQITDRKTRKDGETKGDRSVRVMRLGSRRMSSDVLRGKEEGERKKGKGNSR